MQKKITSVLLLISIALNAGLIYQFFYKGEKVIAEKEEDMKSKWQKKTGSLLWQK
jgi:hypothetical protein